MQKFNTTDILTGYIKQLLHTFNLPKIRVYKKEYKEYYDKYGVEHPEVLQTITTKIENGTVVYPTNLRYIPYIKEGRLQEYVDGQWQELGFKAHNKVTHQHYYNYGDKILNYTKTLRLKDNVYDSYTHEYLGDYLRFKRDYTELNLMPLYNCFSNRICEKLNLEWSIKEVTNNKITEHKYKFSTEDSTYKIYMVPVKLFQEYTIAIDSNGPVEFCCGLYGDYQDTRTKFKNLPKITYQKVSYSSFLKPLLYTKLNWENIADYLDVESEVELLQNECDLKLFIKLPKNNTSTISILEGNYLNWNDTCFYKTPSSIVNINYYGEGEPLNVIPTAENQIYLDTKNCLLYGSYKDALNNVVWFCKGPIWKHSSVDNLGFTTELEKNSSNIYKLNKNFSLYIDSKNYAQEAGAAVTNIETCFKYYQATNLLKQSTKTPKATAYFNELLKQLLINPTRNWERWTNYRVINNENLNDEQDICLSTPLQLLQFNTQEQHPFADRLIEYLLENAITNAEDEIPENIKRAQKIMALNKSSNDYYIKYPGIWDYRMNKLAYEYINSHHNTFEINHDILGYIDKDVEKYYKYTEYTKDYLGKNKEITTSILNAELTEEGN